MAKLQIISSVADVVGEEILNDWILEASASRGKVEFRVVSPWGLRLVEVEEFQLTEEMHPDAEAFRFEGRLGRFMLRGYAHTLAQEGEIDVYTSDEDEVELLTLFKKNQPMTPLEFMTGYPGMMAPSD